MSDNNYIVDPTWTPVTIQDLTDGTGTSLADAIDQINQMGEQLAALVRKATLWDSISQIKTNGIMQFSSGQSNDGETSFLRFVTSTGEISVWFFNNRIEVVRSFGTGSVTTTYRPS